MTYTKSLRTKTLLHLRRRRRHRLLRLLLLRLLQHDATEYKATPTNFVLHRVFDCSSRTTVRLSFDFRSK